MFGQGFLNFVNNIKRNIKNLKNLKKRYEIRVGLGA
jgi:hypothetical protein